MSTRSDTDLISTPEISMASARDGASRICSTIDCEVTGPIKSKRRLLYNSFWRSVHCGIKTGKFTFFGLSWNSVFVMVFLKDFNGMGFVCDVLDVWMNSKEVEISWVVCINSFVPLACEMSVLVFIG